MRLYGSSRSIAVLQTLPLDLDLAKNACELSPEPLGSITMAIGADSTATFRQYRSKTLVLCEDENLIALRRQYSRFMVEGPWATKERNPLHWSLLLRLLLGL